jgi:hypothetical protein
LNLLGKHCGGVFSPFLGSDALCRYVFASGPGIYEMSSREPPLLPVKGVAQWRNGTTACHTKCGADHIPKQGAFLRMDVYERVEAKNHAPLRKRGENTR